MDPTKAAAPPAQGTPLQPKQEKGTVKKEKKPAVTPGALLQPASADPACMVACSPVRLPCLWPLACLSQALVSLGLRDPPHSTATTHAPLSGRAHSWTQVSKLQPQLRVPPTSPEPSDRNPTHCKANTANTATAAAHTAERVQARAANPMSPSASTRRPPWRPAPPPRRLPGPGPGPRVAP